MIINTDLDFYYDVAVLPPATVPIPPFADFILEMRPTGSTYVCDPPVLNTDTDRIVLVQPGWWLSLVAEGFNSQQSEIEYNTQGMFTSLRKGTMNYIVTEHKEFYDKFVFATEIARLLNLTSKEDRVKLFQAITYGEWNFS